MSYGNTYLLKRGDQEHILLINGALMLHMNRAIYQGVFVWGMTPRRSYELPDPTEWGMSN